MQKYILLGMSFPFRLPLLQQQTSEILDVNNECNVWGELVHKCNARAAGNTSFFC